MILGYLHSSKNTLAHNTIQVQDSTLLNNSAGRGGAISFLSSRVKIENTNKIEFTNCIFIGNSATTGTAMHLRPATEGFLFDGRAPTPLLHGCSFIDNHVVVSAPFLLSSIDGATTHVLETGTLHIESIEVELKGNVLISGSTGSGIVATSAKISVLQNTTVHFVNNRATNGGALALIGLSILDFYSDSHDSNIASELGGAIYATLPHQTEFVFSHQCFISYKSNAPPHNWTKLLTFENNRAKHGHAVFADSFLPCLKHAYDVRTDALKWSQFMYIYGYTDDNSIATSPAAINFTLPDEIAPGERTDINSVSVDDLGQPIPSTYHVFLETLTGMVETSPYVSDDPAICWKTSQSVHFNTTDLDYSPYIFV